MNFNQATVLVTGANRGLGRALLSALAHHGVKRIYAATRKPEAITETHGGLIVPIKLDVNDTAAVTAATVQAADTNALINNAGTLGLGSFMDASPELIAQDMQTNYFGTLHLIRAFAPLIERNGGGAIANILSIAALASMPGVGGYSASKAAAFSLTQAIRANLREKGIAVHAVFPGPVDTEMAAEFPFVKTSPQIVADSMITGMERGEEDIFPDPMSEQISQLWFHNPKELERQFAAM